MDNRSSIYSTLFPTSLPFYLHRLFIHLAFILLSCPAVCVYSQGQGISTSVDDTDPGIQYSSGWVALSGNSKEDFDGTEHLCRLQGGTATFTFVGIGVSVLGTIVPQNTFGGNVTKSTYYLDDEPSQSYIAPANITETTFEVLFYQSPTVPNGTHTLRIVNDNEGDWYFLDSLQVLSLAPSQPTDSGSPANNSSPQPVTNVTTLPNSAAVTNTSPAPSVTNPSIGAATTNLTIPSASMTFAPVSLAESHGQTVSPGVAVGIAFSIAVVMGIGVALMIFICQRRRRRNTELARLTAIDPFVQGFLTATNNDGKCEISPPASPAGVETSAQGVFYPYLVEFFSRSRSLRSVIPPSRKSARSAKLNGPLTQSEVPPRPTSMTLSQPVLRSLPVITPRNSRYSRNSARRSMRVSFMSSWGSSNTENENDPADSPKNIQMGIAL